MISVDLSTREYDGHVIVALRGELDIADAVNVAAALAAVAAREPEIIVDLAGLEFIGTPDAPSPRLLTAPTGSASSCSMGRLISDQSLAVVQGVARGTSPTCSGSTR